MADEGYRNALALIQSHRYEEAEKVLANYLSMNTDDYEAWNKLGVTRAHLGRLESAALCFEQAVKINESFAPGYSNIGNLSMQNGDIDKAIGFYEKSISLDPEYSTAYHNLGVAYKKKGDIGSAVQFLKKGARISGRRNSVHSAGVLEKGGGRKMQWVLIACIVGWVLFFLLNRH